MEKDITQEEFKIEQENLFLSFVQTTIETLNNGFQNINSQYRVYLKKEYLETYPNKEQNNDSISR